MIERAQKALDILLEGNERFTKGESTVSNRCVETLKAHKDEQSPIACIVTCSDSRVIPEMIFDKGFGELFVDSLRRRCDW